MEDIQKDLIDIKEFSELFGFKTSYIYKLVHEKRVHYYKPFGKKIFFRLSELQMQFEDSKIEAAPNESIIKEKADNYMLK